MLAIVVLVLNWTWGKIPKQPPVPYGKFATVGDLKIHYVEKPGKDPPVVMIHGLPGTWGDWNAVTTKLAGRHTIAKPAAAPPSSAMATIPAIIRDRPVIAPLALPLRFLVFGSN